MAENMAVQQSSLEDLLKVVNRASESFSYEVWVPSLNKNVMFREINTAQQKRLVKSIIDSPIYNTEFIQTLYKIIEENCTEKIDISNLTIVDKLFIAISMRSVSIGDTLELDIQVGEQTIRRGISLSSLLQKAKEQVKLPGPVVVSDDRGVFTVECDVPNIKAEYLLEKELRSNIDESSVKNVEDLREIIGDAFVTELVKYIKSVGVKTDEATMTKILFNDEISFKDRIAIVERLPARVVERLLEYVNLIKKEIDKVVITTVEVTNKKGKKEIKENIERRLSIDGNFFMSS